MAGIGSVNFGGLISGLDTNQLVDDLVKVDSRPLKRLEERKTDLTKKRDTFTSMKSNLLELKTKAFELKTASSFGAFSASSSDEEALNVNASTSANEGNFSIKILSLAQAETLSGNSYEAVDTDLGYSGEIVLNGRSLRIRTTDSLQDIRNGINSLDAGVTASILKVSDTDYRLIITADTKGVEGFTISNAGASDILGTLGFTDSTKSVRETENGKVLSVNFASAGTTIGSLLDISSKASGTVKIRNKYVSIDLETDTLSTIRDKINDAGINGVTASVESVTENGTTEYRLAITGTEEFTDDGNVLETLGILARGTSGTYAEFQTSALFTSNGSSKAAADSTKLTTLGAVVGETVTISGTDVDGTAVSRTVTIDKHTKIDDILSAVEEAFNDNVTASIDGGRITIRSNVAGSNSLSVSLDAGNEYGGELDFGTVTTVTEGRDRLLVEGQDARIVVNNVEVTRNTNEINDILSGLNLTLKKADPDTVINITVERDRDTIKEKIEDFVKAFNDVIDFVNERSQYDEDKEEAGPLLGDLTARTVVSRIRDAIRSTVFDGDFAYNQLVQIGIETTTEGKLTVDSAKLKDALNDDIDSVISLFTATRETSDNDIAFVYHSEKTKPGTYDVTITRAAERAEVESDAIEGNVGTSGTITITDNYDSELTVDFTEDMTVEDIANSINEEAENTYTRMIRSSTALKQSGGSAAITQNTGIGDIDGVTVEEGDTITVTATNRDGKSYQRVITLEGDGDTTVQDILDAIESMNDYEVTASIDTSGRILVEDRTAGASEIDVTIETTVEGLDFGTFETTREGRNEVIITAEVTEDNRLKIIHENYGSSNTFTISGASALGIEDGEYQGVDIAGSINGAEGTGNGQTLTAAADDENTRGIVIRSAITPEELAEEGPSQGTITLISGIADKLYAELSLLTNPVDGFIQAKIDSLEISLDSMSSQMESLKERIELRRERYVRKFTELEQALAKLQSLQQSLSSSLSSLPTTSLFSAFQ